ncbi:MAG: hypothetical protein GX933_06635 [Chloroflexi bacterium]|mgnify:FL=1|nr:hypothetical protein [Chloroflexota bacterium]
MPDTPKYSRVSQPLYAVIIMDIIDSRSMPDRDDVQQQLKEILSMINRNFSEEIAADFRISLGDEFQGMLSRFNSLMEIVDTIRFKMAPVRLRTGIGIGSISTAINRKNITQIDGPAFYLARESINIIRTNEMKNSQPKLDFVISCNEFPQQIALLNSCLALSKVIEGRWSEKQRKAVETMLYSDLSQKEGASRLAITPSGIQRQLKNADYYNYKFARDQMQQTLTDFGSAAK